MAPLLMGLLRGGPVAYKLIERFLAKHQPVNPTHAQDWSRSTPLNIQHTVLEGDMATADDPYLGFKEKTTMEDLTDLLVEHKNWDEDRNKMVEMLENLQELKDAKGGMWAIEDELRHTNEFYRKSDVEDSRSVMSETLKKYIQPPTQVFSASEGAPRTIIEPERIPASKGIWMDVIRQFKENR